MPNSYFQFKQFKVNQEKSAMKVSTDACILGAYVSQYYAVRANNILDIGSGTGLLTLMLAQMSSCPIQAVEIDENAYLQTQENFAQSPWERRLDVFLGSIQDFTAGKAPSYDLVICNPPFFINSLKSDNKERNLARHTDSLSFGDLLTCVNLLLLLQGIFVVLLPLREAQFFEHELLKYYPHLIILEKLKIQDNPKKEPHRVILVLEKQSQEQNHTIAYKNFIIKDIEGIYTSDFVDLMKDYYLKL